MKKTRKYSVEIVDRPTVIRALITILGALLWTGDVTRAQPPQASAACLDAMRHCESSTDCVHRLAALQASCVTNTCQPQCRESAMNLYQNREGRQLLRSDTSCVPGRYELEKCGFLPNRPSKHCSFAKLICESDLPCNAKWEVFVSECEAETADGRCSEKCRRHLNATIGTRAGGSLASCTCTNRDDNLCAQLRDAQMGICLRGANRTPGHLRPSTTNENDINAGEENERVDDVQEDGASAADSAMAVSGTVSPLVALATVLLFVVFSYA